MGLRPALSGLRHPEKTGYAKSTYSYKGGLAVVRDWLDDRRRTLPAGQR